MEVVKGFVASIGEQIDAMDEDGHRQTTAHPQAAEGQGQGNKIGWRD